MKYRLVMNWLTQTQVNRSKYYAVENLAHFYMDIKQSLIQAGYGWEIDWQENQNPKAIDETTFLSELAWVILSSGMRETVIRSKFPKISMSFYNWQSAKLICSNSKSCFNKAISIFNNKRKIKAILKSCEILIKKSLDRILNNLHESGPRFLEIFPFIGPVTCFHLAKNIGISTAKPDRHLARIASLTGYLSAIDFCNDLSELTGDNISVIDIVFWRYATLNRNYLHQISESITGSI